MKRFLCLIASFCLLLALPSCIQPVKREVPNATTAPLRQETAVPTTASQTGDTTPAPIWKEGDQIAEQFLTTKGIVDCSIREYSYESLQKDLLTLSRRFPSYFSYHAFGKSTMGRDLYVGVLGNPNASRKILVSAAIHGREYLTTLLTMKQLEFYLTYYETGAYGDIPYSTLFRDICIYIVPMTNPDGVMLSQSGLSTVSDPETKDLLTSIYQIDFAEKITGQTTVDAYLQYWKANGRGVDLNRNFDALWQQYPSGRPGFGQYKGPSPASEPETRALVELTESLSGLCAVLCIHSQGEVIYWNCGQEDTLADPTLTFSQAVAARNGYTVKEEKNNDASFSDWCALKKGLIAITVETGKGICPLDADKLPKMWRDNYDLLPLAAHYFLSK